MGQRVTSIQKTWVFDGNFSPDVYKIEFLLYLIRNRSNTPFVTAFLYGNKWKWSI